MTESPAPQLGEVSCFARIPGRWFAMQADTRENGLRRVLGFWALVAFGVGDILGAGIYALTGEIAAIAGRASWMAFGAALAVAGMTALSYAELAGRFPKSGGEAKFCEEGLRSKPLALFVGWLVLCSGVLSMATVAHAFGGYLLSAFEIDSLAAQRGVAALFLVGIAVINFWGIRQTSNLNIFCTIVEAAGLLLVVIVGIAFLAGADAAPGMVEASPGDESIGLTVILSAGALAFFAFIGFEDMVNVAEEVKNPRRTLPLAILTAVGLTGGFYMLVIWVATHVVTPETLSGSDAPLLEVIKRAAPSVPPLLFMGIALFAVGNTGLLNFVTASRLLYGMAGQRLLPAWFGKLHPRTHTPHRATIAVLLIAVTLALSGTLAFLGGATSALILCVFLAVNISLIALRMREKRESSADFHGFRVPLAFPMVAAASSAGLIGFVSSGAMVRASLLAVLGLILVLIRTRRPARR